MGSKNNATEEQCLAEFKGLIKEDKDLNQFNEILSEKFLLHFVRKKYRVKEAFSTLKNYIRVRKDKFPDIFKSLRPTTHLKNENIIRILKNRDEQGRLVIVGYIKHWEPRRTSVDELIGEISLYADELLNFEDVERNGIVQILDFSGFKTRHAKAATPLQMNKFISIFHSALPLKLKGHHIINEMYLVTVIAKSLMMLIPKKLQERLHFHSNNLSSLHKHISPDILPASLNGNLPEDAAYLDLKEIRQRILAKEEQYIQLSEKLNIPARRFSTFSIRSFKR